MPVYQARGYIRQSVDRVVEVMGAMSETYEIVLVDDHSTDGTWEVLKTLKATYTQVRVFRKMHNTGQTPTTLVGAMRARGELIITLDDDLQHPPEEIIKLIEAFDNNDVDIVFGDPENRYHPNRQHPLLVWLGKFMFHNVFMRRYRNINFFTTFRLFRAALLSSNGGQWSHLFFIWKLNPQRAIHISTVQNARAQGESNHTAIRLVRHFAPFLWYFSLKAVFAVQLLLLVGATIYLILQKLYGPYDIVEIRWILLAAVVTLFARLAIAARLRHMAKNDIDVLEG